MSPNNTIINNLINELKKHKYSNEDIMKVSLRGVYKRQTRFRIKNKINEILE